MRVSYLQKNRGRKYAKPALILVAIFVFGSLAFSVFDGALLSSVSPLWEADTKFSRALKGVGAFFSSKRSLSEENTSLRERVTSLELEVAALSSGRVQEGILLDLAGRRESGSFAATVLARPPQTPYDIVVIDAGISDGASEGAEVHMPEGPGLGTIVESFKSRARVRLYTSPGEETEAVLERGNLPVTLIGAGSGNFRIVLPRDTEVEAGDRVLSAGINARLLAVVGGVKMESTDSFKEALAKSPINIFTLRYILVSP